MKERIVVFVHGKGGNVGEADFYRKYFPSCEVRGFGYKSLNPWDARDEFREYFSALKKEYGSVWLVAVSIGAYFSVNAGLDEMVDRAWFISPVADMEALIRRMMLFAGVDESVLEREKVVSTGFGEDLSWEYLCYVKDNPAEWKVPACVLYGSDDSLVPRVDVDGFCRRSGASLTVMDGGEHWFHTDEQLSFLGGWLGASMV